MGKYKSYFQCISDQCNETFSLTDIIYRCPRCENLLEVKHDFSALKKTTADDWMRIFDDRYMRTKYPDYNMFLQFVPKRIKGILDLEYYNNKRRLRESVI